LIAKALCLSGHRVEQSLGGTCLLGSESKVTGLRSVQHVTRPRVAVQLSGTGTSHPSTFPQVGDLLIAQAANLGVDLTSVRWHVVRDYRASGGQHKQTANQDTQRLSPLSFGWWSYGL
jgi:hypothetical protein